MEITDAMLRAARLAEFRHFQLNRTLGAWFTPMPDAQLRAIIEATIAAIGDDDEPAPEPLPEPEEEFEPAPPPRVVKTAIVRARKPRPRR